MLDGGDMRLFSPVLQQRIMGAPFVDVSWTSLLEYSSDVLNLQIAALKRPNLEVKIRQPCCTSQQLLLRHVRQMFL